MMISALSLTPKRRTSVCRKLYETEKKSVEASTPTPEKIETPSDPRALSQQTVKAVQDFYERDDIIIQAPGRKDVVTMWDDRGKKKMQARYLTMSVNEARALFSEEHPELHIGKSKFADLRPKHVLLSRKVPHNVCMCKRH